MTGVQTCALPILIDLLDQLIDEEIGLAVVSNKKHDFTLEIIHKYFSDRFKIVLGLRENYKAKPDPTSVLEVIDEFGISKEECIYIGDSNVDIRTARNAGVKSIGVSWGFRGGEELLKEGADYLVNNVEELKEIIIS